MLSDLVFNICLMLGVGLHGLSTSGGCLLFVVLADLILTVVDIIIGTYNPMAEIGLLGGLFGLAVLIPPFASCARRLHDINKSGWWQLMWFGVLLIFPGLILLWWATKPSYKGTKSTAQTHGRLPHNSHISLNIILLADSHTSFGVGTISRYPPTQCSPSRKTSFFQMGTRVLSCSIP